MSITKQKKKEEAVLLVDNTAYQTDNWNNDYIRKLGQKKNRMYFLFHVGMASINMFSLIPC